MDISRSHNAQTAMQYTPLDNASQHSQSSISEEDITSSHDPNVYQLQQNRRQTPLNASPALHDVLSRVLPAHTMGESATEVMATSHEHSDPSRRLTAVPYTHFDALAVAARIAPIWFLSNLLYSYSLLWSSISSSTIISNLSSSFTLFFAYRAGLETVTYGKLMGIACCFIGVLLVTWHDEQLQAADMQGDVTSTSVQVTNFVPTVALASEVGRLGQDLSAETDMYPHILRILKWQIGPISSSNVGRSLLGDATALLSALLYGYYSVLLRRSVSEPMDSDEFDGIELESQSMEHVGAAGAEGISRVTDESSPAAESTEAKPIPLSLVLGYVGLLVTASGIPVLCLSAMRCWEEICSLNWRIAGFIVLLSIINNFFSEYIWARSVLLTTPTVATVGMSLTIPLAYCIDLLWLHTKGAGSLLGGLGAAITVLGFAFVNSQDACWLRSCTSCMSALGLSS